jgi:hypothetical protein
MIRIERNPGRGQLLIFGLLWLLFFSFWGAMSWLKSGTNLGAVAFWVAAFAVPAAGLVWPEVLRKVYLLASYATWPIGIFVSSVILIFIYYVVVTPIGLVLRLTRPDPMGRYFDRAAETYWVPRKQEDAPERYFKQF